MCLPEPRRRIISSALRTNALFNHEVTRHFQRFRDSVGTTADSPTIERSGRRKSVTSGARACVRQVRITL
jgi:hypothetical protein